VLIRRVGLKNIILLVEMKSRGNTKVVEQLRGCADILQKHYKNWNESNKFFCEIGKRDRTVFPKNPPTINGEKLIHANSGEELRKKLVKGFNQLIKLPG
jgi:hypothetical protein